MQDSVVAQCKQATAVASDMQPSNPDESRQRAEVELAACTMGTRALLTSHKDAEAFQTAQQCLDIARKSFASVGSEDKRWQAMVLSTSLAGLVQHASSEIDSAAESFENVMSLLESEGDRAALDYLIPDALKQAAGFYAAQGRKERAVSLGNRCIAAAEKSCEVASASVDPILSPMLADEAVVDAKLLMAQSCMFRKSWEEAEEKLNDALSAIEYSFVEKTGATQHPCVAMGLLLLAEVYSRTGRVTLSEGLYREILKILGLAPQERKGTDAVHPTVNALAAWRFAQLLTVLPKRETEADAWQKLAVDIYDEAPLQRLIGPEVMFGSLDRLSGKGTMGRGVVLDLTTRRALPCAKNSDTFGT